MDYRIMGYFQAKIVKELKISFLYISLTSIMTVVCSVVLKIYFVGEILFENFAPSKITCYMVLTARLYYVSSSMDIHGCCMYVYDLCCITCLLLIR